MRKYMNKIGKSIAALVALLLLVTSMTIPGYAAEPFDTEAPVSLTLNCVTETKVALFDETFYMYRVADMSVGMNFTLDDAFKDSGVDLSDMDAKKWAETAQVLDAFVAEHDLEPVVTGKTDHAGNLTLKPAQGCGLYLVSGEPIHMISDTYTPTPFLVELPSITVDGSQWDYNPTAQVKYEKNADPAKLVDISAEIRWENDTLEMRPKTVMVYLYAGEMVYDVAEVRADEDWLYIWTDLDPNVDWHVDEIPVPNGYTMRQELGHKHELVSYKYGNAHRYSAYKLTSGKKTIDIESTYMHFIIINRAERKPPVPTGDPTNIAMLMTVAGLSLAGTATVIVLMTRSKKREERAE